MKITDYSKIAGHYDNNPIRHYQPREMLIEEILKSTHSEVNILDLACGTGNFLKAQQQAYCDKRIKWSGCDLSKEMLNIAREKLPFAELKNASAANLPYANESFNMVSCNYAFHHFKNKLNCIREIYRILKSGGVFLLKNMCLEYMAMSWIYHYFPDTVEIDRKRFWNNKKLLFALEDAGFQVDINVEIICKRVNFDEILNEAENRDVSQLNLISDAVYYKGLKRILKDKESGKAYLSQFAGLRCVAYKKH